MLVKVPEREERLKVRRRVFEVVKKFHSDGQIRGAFAVVARQLGLTKGQARNYFKQEEKGPELGGGSSEEYFNLSGGQPTTMVFA